MWYTVTHCGTRPPENLALSDGDEVLERRSEYHGTNATTTLTRAYKLSVLHLVLFLASFVVMGYIKLWVYDWGLTDESTQIKYSKQYGWLQLVGGLVALASFLWQIVSITNTAQDVHQFDGKSTTVYKWREVCEYVCYKVAISRVCLSTLLVCLPAHACV